MTTPVRPPAPPPGAVNRLVPYAHVADVESSLAFYALLGFTPENAMKDARGRTFWALARSGKAEIMFASASGPIDPADQAVLFYLYSDDLAALRRYLLKSGLHDAGRFPGAPAPLAGRKAVFDLAYPHHMPAGECRVHDPDGYVILIGQLA